MVNITCPNCGATVQISDSRLFAFCQYCGTKIANENNQIDNSRAIELKNLITRALEFEARGDYMRAEEYCSRILDMDPSNSAAREIEMRLPSYTPMKNIHIVYNSILGDRYKLRVTLDGKNWNVLNPNEELFLSLPIGNHNIRFSGTKTYNQSVNVTNKNELITITYTAEKRRNTIVVSN